MRQPLNFNWEYIDEFDSEFLHGGDFDQLVDIPHNVQEMPIHQADHNAYQKIVGYRKTIYLPEEYEGQHIFLIFEGVGHLCEVYCNGTLVGEHRNGYTMFRVEITKEVKLGQDNQIVVKVDSREDNNIPPFGHVIDYLTYGGIYRPVYLEVRPISYIEDLYVTTPSLHRLDLQLQFNYKDNSIPMEITIYDDQQQTIYQNAYDQPMESIHLHVKNAKSWSITSPNLYTLVVKYGQDEQCTTFGFRTIAIKGDDFLLNGEKVFLTGLNRHQCYPYIGYAATDSLQMEDARILKEELHVNTVRTSHYPQSQSFIDACDRLGLFVITEIPGWQYIGDEKWQKQAIENTKEMVLQYRNHPSVIMWGVRINESLDNDDFYAKTNAVARKYDPTRFTTGVRYLEKSHLLEDVYGFNDFSHSGKNPGVKQKKEVMREHDKPLFVSESNGHMFPTKAFDRPDRLMEHALRHARVLNDAKADHQHIGAIQWCMFDYQTHKDFGSGDRICYHGVMDMFRNPKLAASVYASQADIEPVLEIGTNMNIGDYDGGHLDAFYVFSNADEIRLYKNDVFVKSFVGDERFSALEHAPIHVDDTIGELLATQEGLHGNQEKLVHDALLSAQKFGLADLPKKDALKLGYVMLRYKMAYSEGVELYGKYVGGWGEDVVTWRFDAIKDGIVVKSVIKKPSTKLHLEGKASSLTLHEADTYDMAAFRIRLLDEYDNVVPYVQIPMEIAVDGPIEIVGPHIVTLEAGMSGTYIRSKGKSGVGHITFSTNQTEDLTFTIQITCEEK